MKDLKKTDMENFLCVFLIALFMYLYNWICFDPSTMKLKMCNLFMPDLVALKDLPINVIYQIQEHMDIEDFARMSVLSIMDSSEQSVFDEWILYLSRNGLMDFTLLNLENVNAPYKLHSAVSVWNYFGGFIRLRSRQLNRVIFELDVASSFIRFPNLELLVFLECSGIHHLNIHAPELSILKFEHTVVDTIKLDTFMDCRKLKVFVVFLHEEVSQNRQHEVMKWIKLLSRLEVRRLISETHFIKFLASANVAGRLSMRLNLRVLGLHDLDFNDEDHICSLLCILRSSPNLMTLRFLLKASREVDVNHFEGKRCSRIDELNNLRALEIFNFHGSRAELMFVKLVLASAPSLQKVIVEVDKEVSESQTIKIYEELKQISRQVLNHKVIFQ
ncbi:F-box/FBD/LRR-repeat protein At1g13570-like [Lycium barbarum]|uniref:F-box/FBD/LRR-repeat protein At1g13570-like n=1 Tax=Lycium barbarum TaxID=112863 RepID=UPI00293F0D30|nr:F-box/FBD/LRR-repeat protein At1g13570-like [Lycium barbarum]